MTLTATDFFCGVGGSSSGLREAGIDIVLAANHWDRAIESHSANFPGTEHLCADMQAVDMRYLPATDILWASPICTELSPAGGRRKAGAQGRLWEEYGHVATEAFDRTRVTFWEVVRAVEIHRYTAVLIENVPDVADWLLFPEWLSCMDKLGYTHQIISASAAHIGGDQNRRAPQWRDRLYIIFLRRGITARPLESRPLAWCPTCGQDVPALQLWNPRRKHTGWHIGKYRSQYHYVCPEGHGRLEPYTAPATEAIDWTDLGTPVGSRTRPLAEGTLARIDEGLELIASGRMITAVNHTGPGRHFDPADAPLPTRSTRNGEALVTTPEFVVTFRNHARPHPVTEPLATFSAQGHHHGLVIPFRRGAHPYPADRHPLSTTATHAQHGVMTPRPRVEDCLFRMLSPREAANAQRFTHDYVILGTLGEQQMQAGNAVPVNVSHWIGDYIISTLDSDVGVAA